MELYIPALTFIVIAASIGLFGVVLLDSAKILGLPGKPSDISD
jgi:preprotein translocase subunit SecG